MQVLWFIICIAIVIGAIYRATKRKSSVKEQNETNAAFLDGNPSAPNLDKPCHVKVYCDLSGTKNAGYYFSLNGWEKQRVNNDGYVEFQTVKERNILDGFGGGNGFAGSRLGKAVDSYRFNASSGGLVQLISKPGCSDFDAGLFGFTTTTWHNNISEHISNTEDENLEV